MRTAAVANNAQVRDWPLRIFEVSAATDILGFLQLTIAFFPVVTARTGLQGWFADRRALRGSRQLKT
jgi:hypothetical protein